jgi:predicted small metal-binding protein
VLVSTTTICKGCGVELTAETEDELVTKLQAHLAEAHPGAHSPTREQVIAVLRKRSDDAPQNERERRDRDD